jgi:hypothetical protein
LWKTQWPEIVLTLSGVLFFLVKWMNKTGNQFYIQTFLKCREKFSHKLNVIQTQVTEGILMPGSETKWKVKDF